jgi:hypothetical protein
MLKTTTCLITVASLSAMIAGPTRAAWASDQETSLSRRITVCDINNRLRLNGTEQLHTFLTLRNINPTAPILINRMRVFDAQANVLFDSATSGLPESTSGVWGTGNNVVNPHQSAQWDSAAFIPVLDASERPAQVEILWSAAAQPARSLVAGTTNVSNARNATTGALLSELSRTSGTCRTLREY